jgi:peptidyl-prolyl cis-trans isomerase D
MPEFQEEGKFSETLYQSTLEQNRLTASKFENSIRNDLLVQQARDNLARLAFAPKSTAEQAVKFTFQERDVTTAEIKGADFLSQVEVTPEEVKDLYELHQDKFMAPEQVKLEFALLSAAGLVAGVKVTDEEVKDFYEQNRDKFQGDEQRRASHILLSFGVSATDEDKLATKDKALEILGQLETHPKRFEELATKFSQDPGSAAKGGDLGNFGRGAMVAPFEDAVFNMEVDQISELVESEFGYHIIRLDGITGTSSSFEDLKAQIKGDLIYQSAQIKYAEFTEEFSNIVYEQSGSLQPVAKQMNLQLQTTDWMSREEGAKFFKTDKLINMVFADEVLKEKRNTEAVEVSPNNLVSARVLEYKAETPRTFDEVKGGIADLLKIEKALKLAEEEGAEKLTQLKAGESLDALEWISTVTVDRKNAQGLTDSVMNQVFKMNAETLPAYVGFLDAQRAYVLVKLSRVASTLGDEDAQKMAHADYEAALANEYIAAYGKSLKAKQTIEVNRKLIYGDDQ